MQMLFSLLVTDISDRSMAVREVVTWIAAATVGTWIARGTRGRRQYPASKPRR